MSDVRCPSCGDVFRIPDVPLPDDAMAACPWCGNYLRSSELRKAPPPLALLVDSEGRPLTGYWGGQIPQAFAAPESQDASESSNFERFSAVADSPTDAPFPASDELRSDKSPAAGDFRSPKPQAPASEEVWEADEELADTEPEFDQRDPSGAMDDLDDENGLDFGRPQLPRPLDQVSSFQFSDEVTPMPYARAKQPKNFSPVKTLFGIVLGGLLAVPLAGIFLALMGRPLDLGFWPFLGNADPPFSSRVASQPMEPRQRPRITGRSMLTDEARDSMAAADDGDEPIRPIFPTATPDESATVRIEPEVPSPVLIFPDAKPENSANAADASIEDELALPPEMDAVPSPPKAVSTDPVVPRAAGQSEPGPSVTEPSTTPRAPSTPKLTLPPADPAAPPTREDSEDSTDSKPEPTSSEPPVALTPPVRNDPAAVPQPPSIARSQPAGPTQPVKVAQPAVPAPRDSSAQTDRTADLPVARISAESSDAADTGSDPPTVQAIADTGKESTPATAAISARLKPFMDEIDAARERLFAVEDSDDPVSLRRRWAELYVGLAKLALVATPADRIPLENLSKRLSEDELTDSLSQMSPNWLRLGKRPSEGILLVGMIERSEGKSWIRWGENSAVELRGIDETVAGTSGQVFALGKILSSGSRAVVEITFARPLDR